MPIYNTNKGLKGLEGIRGLSVEERNQWIDTNKDILPDPNTISPSTYDEVTDIMYRNSLFKDKFSDRKDYELLKRLPFEERNKLYKDVAIGEEFDRRFKEDRIYPETYNLTTEGKELLLNSNYSSDSELELQELELKDTLKEIDDTSSILRNLALYSSGDPYGNINREELLEDSSESFIKSKKNKQKGILEDIIAEDNYRKLDMVEDLSSAIANKMLEELNNGSKTEKEIDDDFEAIAFGSPSNPGSRYYKAFKGTDELLNLTTTDKLKFLALHMAMLSKFGLQDANSALDTLMQEFISELLNALDWGINTGKNMFVGGVAHLMNTAMGIEGLYKYMNGGEEALEKFLNGKDENGENSSKWNNPLYWLGVDQFNTFDENEINKARLNGGLSKYQNVTLPGEEMEFFSWNTANEAAKQFKYIWADYLTSKVFSGTSQVFNKLAGKLGPKLGQIAEKTTALGTVAATGVGNSEAEGLSSYQSTIEEGTPDIDFRLDLYLDSLVDSAILSDESKQKILERVLLLKDYYASPEQGNKKFLDETPLFNQATYEYKQQLRLELSPVAKAKFQDEREALKRAAVGAYVTTATIDELRTSTANFSFRKYLFDKGTRKALGDNTPNINFEETSEGLMRVKPMTKMLRYGKPILRNMGGEFIDEYTDNLVNSFGLGFGLSKFNNYLEDKYNPEVQSSGLVDFINNFIGGWDKALDATTDKQAFYEGFIGALGAGTNVAPRLGAVRKKNRLRYDEEGNLLPLVERINNYIMNPILNDIAETYKAERGYKKEIEAVNEVLKDKGEDLLNISSIISVLLNKDKYLNVDTSGIRGTEDEETNTTILDALDAKLKQAFNVMLAISALSSSEVGSQSSLYQLAMSTIEQLANDEMPKEELDNLITLFLGQKLNLTINSNDREAAALKLKENAQSLLETKKSIDEVNNYLDSTPLSKYIVPDVRLELQFLNVMNNNWRSRLQLISLDLGVDNRANLLSLKSFNSSEYASVIGNRKHLEKEIKNRNSQISSLELKINNIKEEISDTESKIKLAKNANDKNRLRIELSKNNLLLNTYKQQLESLQVEVNKMSKSLKVFDENETPAVLSKEEIMSLGNNDRALMVNPKNARRYSKEQRLILNDLRKDLRIKNPALLQEILDAALILERLQDSEKVMSKFLENPFEAASYTTAQKKLNWQRTLRNMQLNSVRDLHDRIQSLSDEDKIKEVRNISSKAIEDYIKIYPEDKKLLTPLVRVAQLREDAALIIKNYSDLSDALKLLLRQSIINITEDSNDISSAMTELEKVIDSDLVDLNSKIQIDRLLHDLENRAYVRDSTIYGDRKARELKLQQRLEELRKLLKDRESKAKESTNLRQLGQEGLKLTLSIIPDLGEKGNKKYSVKESIKDITPQEYHDNIDPALVVANTDLDYVNLKVERESNAILLYLNGEINEEELIRKFNYTEEYINRNKLDNKLKDIANSLVNKYSPYIQLNIKEKVNEDIDTSEDGQAFAKAALTNTVESYQEYLDNQVDGKYRDAARAGLWLLEKKYNDKDFNLTEESLIKTLEEGKSKVIPSKKEDSTEDNIEGNIPPSRPLSPSPITDKATIEEANNVVGKGDPSSLIDDSLVDVDLTDGKAESPTNNLLATELDNQVSTIDESEESEEEEIKSLPTSLLGNLFYRFESKILRELRVLRKRKGKTEGDLLDKVFNWLDTANIKLQDIIDSELGDIITANPKIQFMAINPLHNVTNDNDLLSIVFNVVKYTKEVQAVHNESLGGVVSANGEQWLIIGVLGFDGEAQGDNFRQLVSKGILPERQKYFKANSSERFYVSPNYNTKVKDIINGTMPRQLEDENEPKTRSITELINDPNRNLKGLQLEDLKWMITSSDRENPIYVNASSRNRVLNTSETDSNVGNVWLLIEGSDGTYIPAYINPVFYNEIKDGKLKDTIQEYLNLVISPDYNTRLNAVKVLGLLLNLKTNNILIGTEGRNTVSITSGDSVIKTFDLSSSGFNRLDFFKAILDLNPRINITKHNLSTKERLNILDEAGALTIDIAKLGVSNTGYTVYSVNDSGNPNITQTDSSNYTNSNNSEYTNKSEKHRSSILYKGKVYRKRDGQFRDSIDNKVIEDLNLILKLEYALYIKSNNLAPQYSLKHNNVIYDYYIVNMYNSGPKVIKKNFTTGEVTIANEEQSLKLMERIAEKEAQEKRQKAILEENDANKGRLKEESLEDVDLGEYLGLTPTPVETELEKPLKPIKPDTEKAKDINHASTESLENLRRTNKERNENPKNLLEIISSSVYSESFFNKAESLWGSIPDDTNQLEKFLNDKGIETSNIINPEDWIKSLECHL